MTAQVTVYADAGITVDVVAGSPPVDQSAAVATLNQQLTVANGTIATLNANLAKLKTLAGQLDTNDAAQDTIRAQIHAITG